METFRINYIMYGLGRTGGTRVLLNFINQLSYLGHEVSITTLARNDWFPISKDVKIITKRSRIDFIEFLVKELLYKRQLFSESSYFSATLVLLKKLYNLLPDADVNVGTVAPTAYVASWKAFKGAVPFYHMQHLETINYDSLLMKKFVLDSYNLPIYKIANSSWLSLMIQKFVGAEIPVINPAIEHDIFYYREEKHNKPEYQVNIVCLAKGGWKNAKGIYDAIKIVREKELDKMIILHFFGHKPIPGIPFDGKLNIFHRDLSDLQLAALYSSCDIQITFSMAESFPLPPLEAMASGCSIITTPFGVEDYVVKDKNALIVKPNDISELVEKVILLIENNELRRELIREGLKTVDRFRYEQQVKLLVDQIKKAQDEFAEKNSQLYKMFI